MEIHATVMRRILANSSRLLFRTEVDMTLLELLVKELPGHGGWPRSVFFMTQDADGQVNKFKNITPPLLAMCGVVVDSVDTHSMKNICMLHLTATRPS